MNYHEFENFKLCFVGNGFAYFTNQDVATQDGPLWDKVPYEDGAGAPYVPLVLQEGDLVVVVQPNQDEQEQAAMVWSKKSSPRHQCLKVMFESSEYIELVMPSDLANGESGLSVRSINAAGGHWLHARVWSPTLNCYVVGDSVAAGATVGQFSEFLKRNDGVLYIPATGLKPYPQYPQ